MDGDSTTSLGCPFHCLIALSVKKFFPISTIIIIIIIIIIITTTTTTTTTIEESYNNSETLTPFWTRAHWGAKGKARDWDCKFGVTCGLGDQKLGTFCCLMPCVLLPILTCLTTSAVADPMPGWEGSAGWTWWCLEWRTGGTGTATSASIWHTEAANEEKGRRG